MDDLENLEKLAKLKDKGIINDEEFLLMKRNIVSRNMNVYPESKSGIAYALLAWFLGIFGAHNFYAGYTRRAIAQLLLTVFSWLLFFIPLIVVQIWALADMCLINKDAQGASFPRRQNTDSDYKNYGGRFLCHLLSAGIYGNRRTGGLRLKGHDVFFVAAAGRAAWNNHLSLGFTVPVIIVKPNSKKLPQGELF